MYMELFRNQVVAPGVTTYSQAFEIGDDNAVFVAMYVSGALASGALDVKVQGSNDLTNWVPYGSATLSISPPSAGPHGGTIKELAARYQRLEVALGATATGPVTFSGSVNSQQL